MAFADTYLQTDAPDPVLSEETVVAVAARHAPDAVRRQGSAPARADLREPTLPAGGDASAR